MPQAQRLGDPNNGGGVLAIVPQTTVLTNNVPQAVIGSQGTGHRPEVPPHCPFCWATAVGADSVFAQNLPTNYTGHVDTCGHIRVGGSPNVFIEDTWPMSTDPKFPNRDFEDPSAPLYGQLDGDEYISNEIEDENTKVSDDVQLNECSQESLSRVGNPSGLQTGEVADPNKIENVQIVVKCDLTVDTTMKLTPPTTDVAAPATVTWSWTGVTGLNLNPSSGRITGVVPEGNYNTAITAKDGDTIIDSKTFKIVSDKCDDEFSIRFIHPLPGSRCTSKVSMTRVHPVSGKIKPHRGCDFAYPGGKTGPVLAAAEGIVLFAGTKTGYGNVVILGHFNRNGDQMCCTLYAHLASISVTKRQNVSSGQQLGIEGNTGIGTGAHLHFEIRSANYINSANPALNQQASVYDPLEYIQDTLTFDGSNLVKANNTGNPSDPGDANGAAGTVKSNTNVALRRSEATTKCEAYAQPMQTNDDGKPPEGEVSGTAKSPFQSTCAPTSPVDTATVLTQIKTTLDIHPELDQEDKDFIILTARIESGFDPYAKNPTSSAMGLYQFLVKLANRYGLMTCEDRCDPVLATEAMISFYKNEIKRYYDGWIDSGKLTIAGKPIVPTPHSYRYSSLPKRVWCYGLIHHDGVGNAVKGIDKGGVDYVLKRLNSSV